MTLDLEFSRIIEEVLVFLNFHVVLGVQNF
jgi:hypothetical protein